MRVLVVLLLLPTAAGLGIDNPDEATEVTLYPHLLGRMDMPMTTQPPPAHWSYSEVSGIVPHSQGCVEVPGLGLASSTHHTIYGYALPGMVTYGDDIRLPAARGIHADLHLDTSTPVRLTWYLEPEWVPLFDGDAPTVVPMVSLRATLRQGDDISVDHQAMDQGRIIALGQTPPTEFLGPATDSPYVSFDGIYEVSVPLIYTEGAGVVPAQESFNLRIDLFVDVPGCNDPAAGQYLMPDWLRHHTSDGHRPRLDWSIKGPVQVRSMETSIVNGTLIAQADIDTVWGPYNLGDVSLTVDGPTTMRFAEPTTRESQPYESPFGRRYTWTWNFTDEDAPRGDYRINLTALDAQGNGPATASLPFAFGSQTTTCSLKHDAEALCHTEKDKHKDSPAPVGLGVLALALLRHRGQ